MYSKEHLNFLKKRKRDHRLVVLTQICILVLFIVIWQLLADLGIINTFITSSPKKVVETFLNLAQHDNLGNHVLITVYETLLSFGLGTFIGILIATIMWWNKFIQKVIDPYLTVLNSLPKVALGPIIIVWCGANQKSIILMALLISVIIMTLNVYESFSSIDSNQLKLMKVMGAKKHQIFFKLILPSSYHSILSALKICISMSLIGVIMGEFLVSKAGVGYLIMYGSQVFNLNLVVTGIFLLAILSWGMYSIIYYLEKRLTKKR